MPKLKDLTGQSFGRLVVLYQADSKNKRVYWHCRCSCGREIDIRADSLTSGNTVSCGCYLKETASRLGKKLKLDLTGQRFNRLIVLEEDFSKKRVAWKCQCDCGNTTIVTSDALRGGTTQSCGCLQRERAIEANKKEIHTPRINIINKRFGKLTVIEIYKYQDNDMFYKCRCDCGNIAIVSGTHLRSGHTLSCGCIKSSYYASLIGNILEELNIPYEKERTFKTCINPKTNNKLRFDFYIDNKILLEYDGIQHFKDSPILKEYQYRDNIKNEWCKQEGIPLIRISYKENKNINIDYIKSILKEYGYSIK